MAWALIGQQAAALFNGNILGGEPGATTAGNGLGRKCLHDITSKAASGMGIIGQQATTLFAGGLIGGKPASDAAGTKVGK